MGSGCGLKLQTVYANGKMLASSKQKYILSKSATQQKLGARNRVKLLWVQGHDEIAGNEFADEHTRKGSITSLTGPEPEDGGSYTGKHYTWFKTCILIFLVKIQD